MARHRLLFAAFTLATVGTADQGLLSYQQYVQRYGGTKADYQEYVGLYSKMAGDPKRDRNGTALSRDQLAAWKAAQEATSEKYVPEQYQKFSGLAISSRPSLSQEDGGAVDVNSSTDSSDKQRSALSKRPPPNPAQGREVPPMVAASPGVTPEGRHATQGPLHLVSGDREVADVLLETNNHVPVKVSTTTGATAWLGVVALATSIFFAAAWRHVSRHRMPDDDLYIYLGGV